MPAPSAVLLARCAAVALLGLTAACGGSGNSSASSTAVASAAASSEPAVTASASGQAQAGTADAQVRTVWTEFFSGSTPAAQKVQLLQNGDRFAQLISAQSSSGLASQTSVTVDSVKVDGPVALVNYTLLVGGKPVLPNLTGTAVQVNGQWKVSETALCSLLALQSNGRAPSPCPTGSASPAGSPSAS